MSDRKVYDDEKHVQFVTFSCFKRRKYLAFDRAKRIVIGSLGSRLAIEQGSCLGFVVMPDHVHAMIWFPMTRQLSSFMNKWKEQSSKQLKAVLPKLAPSYWKSIPLEDPVWQTRYYSFNIWSHNKVKEKLDYMHQNPVRAGFVDNAIDWPWSSARWYVQQKSVGLPIRWPPGLESE